MPYTDYTEDFLELKDVTITFIKNTPSEKQIGIALKRQTQICPCCGKETDHVHDYRVQRIKDIAITGRFTVLFLRKRRYVCTHCGKRFPESNTFLARYQRTTGRMRQYIISRFSQMRSATSIATECNCSITTAIRFFGSVQYPKPNLPPIISIDEFKGNAGGHKFQCILTNPKKKTLLDILESRNAESLYAYFGQYETGQKNNVKYVVMDMSGAFKAMAKTVFPNAKIVADKFHVCRLITWAMERTRIQAQKDFEPSRRKYFKKSRWILKAKKQVKRGGKSTIGSHAILVP